MFGCGSCGCLRLANPPKNLDRFYPDDYYSFVVQRHDVGLLGRALRSARTFVLLRRHEGGPEWATWLRGNATIMSSILDYGSGAGTLVAFLRKQGFWRVVGFDAYAKESDLVVNELPDGPFDLVMMHHVLEHLDNHVDALASVVERLTPAGKVLIRMPLVDSWAYREYGSDWVGLDPPRHLLLHTSKSLRLLGERVGLVVEKEWRDSGELQFCGSEQYRLNIPLVDPRGGDLFADQMEAFRERAAALNSAGEGDQGVFMLRRHSSD
jgi:SAM-dependent methyltransferase